MIQARQLLCAAAFATLAACGAIFGGGSAADVAVPAESSARFGSLPEVELLDSTGAVVSPARLKGSTWALATLSRPLRLTTEGFLNRLLDVQEILAGTDIRLVSLSMDPLVDRPAVLAEFGAERGIDPESWFLWTGEEPAVYRLLQAAYRGALDGIDEAEMNAHMAVSFEPRVVVIDANGDVRGAYDLFADDGPELLLARLRAVDRE